MIDSVAYYASYFWILGGPILLMLLAILIAFKLALVIIRGFIRGFLKRL